MLLAARCRAALLVLHVFLLCEYAKYISQFQRGSAMLLAARCRAALLVLHVFFVMLVCSVYFTIPTGQRDAVGCTLSCCAAGFVMLVCSIYFTIPTGQRDAVCCTLSCCGSGFACFF